MNGKNGNILEGYYSRRNKPDWTLVFALCGIIATLIGIIWYDSKERTDLKIELSKRDTTIFILEHQKAMRIVTPD